MENVTAGDIMIPLDEYPHIPYWFTLRQAVAEIQHSELDMYGKKSLARAVLVFDEEYKLLGMVRRRDIMKGLEPERFFAQHAHHQKNYFEFEPDPNLLEISSKKVIRNITEQMERPVSKVMVPIDHTLEYDDHLLKIIYEMNHYETSMLPVMKDNAVVGVVRTVEVIDEISKKLHISD